jgi:hypothetical protein
VPFSLATLCQEKPLGSTTALAFRRDEVETSLYVVTLLIVGPNIGLGFKLNSTGLHHEETSYWKIVVDEVKVGIVISSNEGLIVVNSPLRYKGFNVVNSPLIKGITNSCLLFNSWTFDIFAKTAVYETNINNIDIVSLRK